MASTAAATEGHHAVEHVALGLVDQLPLLLIMAPFCAAPLIVLIGSRKLAWPIAYAAVTASFVMAVFLMMRVIGGEVISYHIGGWAPPMGIEYRIDAANAFVLLLVTGIAAVVMPYARISILAEVGQRHQSLFYSCFLLCFTGLLGVAITGDAFNVFVFLEISSLATYVLIAAGAEKDRRALTAAYDYLIMGTIGATFFVIGLGLLYMATGTLNMADIAERIADQQGNRTVRAAFAFIVVGMGLKAAIYPLHLWLPNAYTYAPSAVTTFLAATATKVAIYVLMRFMFTVFQPQYLFEVKTLEFIVIPLAILAMFAASLIAIFQTDLKRLLAYSSLAQIGYMLLGIGFLSETGLTAAIAHLFNHGITKAALFMGVGALALRYGNSFLDRIGGAGKTMPWTSAAMVIGGLSLIGVPGTAGFVSKWVLVQAAFEAGWWPVAILIVLSSLLAVIYVWKMVEVLYLAEPAEDVVVREAPAAMLVPLWVMAIACVWFGLNTDLSLAASLSAAKGFIAGSAGMADVPGIMAGMVVR